MTNDTDDTIKKEREETKKKFLESLAMENVAGNVLVACKIIGKSRGHLYILRKEDPDFASQWDQVRDEAMESFADFAESQLFGAVKEGNIAAILFTLKNLRSERWKERRELGTADGKPIEVKMPGLVDLIRQRYPDAADILHGTAKHPESTGG